MVDDNTFDEFPLADTSQLDNPTDVVEMIDDIIMQLIQAGLPGEAEMRGALRAAIDAEEYMRVYKQRMTVSATTYGPRALKALGAKAAAGDVPAIKVLFEVIGLTGKQPYGPNVMTQVNVNVPTLKDLLEKEAQIEYEVKVDE